MWASNGQGVINQNTNQISGTVRYSPADSQDCIADMNKTPYPYNIVITVTLDPEVYTGEFTFVGEGTVASTASGSGNVVTITLAFAGHVPGTSGQWNVYAKTHPGITAEQAKFKAKIRAVSYPEVKWIIREPHNQWMTNRTVSSYDY